jgi:hypothetical protein
MKLGMIGVMAAFVAAAEVGAQTCAVLTSFPMGGGANPMAALVLDGGTL